MTDSIYLCIDLKSFYASVECASRGLDPLTTNLVVADPSRGRGTICLAVSPSMKALGVRNRCRIFEIPANLPYITAPPRMQVYINRSADIYAIYLTYVAREDIHVYSIDEAFLDVTNYLSLYHMSAHELGNCILRDIRSKLGLYATCGIGSNLYLAKVALDILAKHSPDFIAELTEVSYQKILGDHQPLQDFWKVGLKTASKLQKIGIFTMNDILHTDEAVFYRLLGINAEYLIDHAHGREPTTIAQIKAYKSRMHSISSGQILPRDYTFEETELAVKEMTAELCLDLVSRNIVCESFSLYLGYAKNELCLPSYGSSHLAFPSASSPLFLNSITHLFRKIGDPTRHFRRITIDFWDVTPADCQQYSLFCDPSVEEKNIRLQKSINAIRTRYGKNALLRGMDLEAAATTRERNQQIGGHRAGKESEPFETS